MMNALPHVPITECRHPFNPETNSAARIVVSGIRS